MDQRIRIEHKGNVYLTKTGFASPVEAVIDISRRCANQEPLLVFWHDVYGEEHYETMIFIEPVDSVRTTGDDAP